MPREETAAGWVTARWLDLREPCDAAARSTALVDALRPRLRPGRLVVHDLGCGTGALMRWLAPQLRGAQHWVLHDRDASLLAQARDRGRAVRDAGGGPVTLETRPTELAALQPRDLTGATLVTASALFDILTGSELRQLVAAAMSVAAPLLASLTVTGRVELTPAHPLDAVVEVAFNEHQRRGGGGRPLLGPAAAETACRALAAAGAEVRLEPSVWRLGPPQAALLQAWFDGWVGAAREQRPELAGVLGDYCRLRRRQHGPQALSAAVHHVDLLALNPPHPLPGVTGRRAEGARRG